jgi:mannose-6-phosphate isomerase-like protein (cupin superfamily)
MSNIVRLGISDAQKVTDPISGSGEIALFPDAMGQNGCPFIMHVEDPPNKTRPRHHHHADVVYVFTKGELHIEGEGTYRAGDIRWTRAGHAYGPETTGPDGGAWWVVTNGDPIPVNHPAEEVDQAPKVPTRHDVGGLACFEAPHPVDEIARTVLSDGGVILKEFVRPDLADVLDAELDDYIGRNPVAGRPQSGSHGYDVFLGYRTLRLHGLATKLPSAGQLIADPRLMALSRKLMDQRTTSILLNAGEVIQIGPGEPAQFLHRDSDSWPDVQRGIQPFVVNAILALDDFTLENGATCFAPGSHAWEPHRQAKPGELVRAVMKRGDVLFFRGDAIHGGGENATQARRRAISVSYCAGWLRPVENSYLNVPPNFARTLSPPMQDLLGYAAHDSTSRLGGLLGLFEGGDPRKSFESSPGDAR